MHCCTAQGPASGCCCPPIPPARPSFSLCCAGAWRPSSRASTLPTVSKAQQRQCHPAQRTFRRRRSVSLMLPLPHPHAQTGMLEVTCPEAERRASADFAAAWRDSALAGETDALVTQFRCVRACRGWCTGGDGGHCGLLLAAVVLQIPTAQAPLLDLAPQPAAGGRGPAAHAGSGRGGLGPPDVGAVCAQPEVCRGSCCGGCVRRKEKGMRRVRGAAQPAPTPCTRPRTLLPGSTSATCCTPASGWPSCWRWAWCLPRCS